MGTLTRLASTLTAKYFPSQTLTDAFYIDGRLFGKRETRQADITIDKEERGFFFSVFAHPRIPEYEPGMMPPYEPQLRGTCNEVKFGRKEIDGMIEGFLSTAIDVTGKMKLADGQERNPYFAGVIVRDAEAFAVTIGSGLAFLYRDDVLFPLTDAGIPMEPIDTDGNRVSDFMYYCSSKTANALWSNFFTLSPDDCIILCNKEIYDALGQREILRILAEADDQCDAAGVIITQASARMPNTPMQFSISFVESVTSDEKRGLFGFKKKNRDEDTSEMSIKSTLEGGVVGAAAEAAADAGFTGGLAMTDSPAMKEASLLFGDDKPGFTAPAGNQVASQDQGIVVGATAPGQPIQGIEFLDDSAEKKPIVELSAEDMMKQLLNGGSAAAGAAAGTAAAGAAATAGAEAAGAAAAGTAASASAGSPFVASFNPFEMNSGSSEVKMETVASTAVNAPEEDDNSKTKPVIKLDTSALELLKAKDITSENEPAGNADIPEIPVRDLSEDREVVEVKPDNETESRKEIVFSADSDEIRKAEDDDATAQKEFDPYGVGSGEEMQNAAPIVFGDDTSAKAEPAPEVKETGIPVPEFDISSDKPELEDKDKLNLDFPVMKEEEKPEAKEAPAAEETGFTLPFENQPGNFIDEPATEQKGEDIPEMPVFDGNTFDTPVVAVNSEAPVNEQQPADIYSYGQYVENENMAEQVHEPVQPAGNEDPYYDPYGAEGNNYYTNDGYAAGYQPGQYQDPMQPDPYAAAAAAGAGYAGAAAAGDPYATAPQSDADWIESILGLEGEDDQMGTSNEQVPPMNNSYRNSDTGFSYGDRSTGRPGGPAKPAASGGGRGGNGPHKVYKINRNGYIFIAFVAVCLILLIVMISAIVKSCGKSEASESVPEESIIETEDTKPVETTAAPTEVIIDDPSLPIGRFYFSNHDGFRTWYDLFKTVYGIEISSETDSRVATILTYNGLDPATFVIGEQGILLPPSGVLDGTIEVTFIPGAPQTQVPDSGVNGTPQVGTDETEAGTEDTSATEADAGADAAQ